MPAAQNLLNANPSTEQRAKPAEDSARSFASARSTFQLHHYPV